MAAFTQAQAEEFQSTRPRGARPILLTVCATTLTFQSTRPRGARRLSRLILRRIVGVSIHAPARGATRGYVNNRFNADVSIHAPARGATDGSRIRILAGDMFQSTRPRGARLLAGGDVGERI